MDDRCEKLRNNKVEPQKEQSDESVSVPTRPKGLVNLFKSSQWRLLSALIGMTFYLLSGAFVFSRVELTEETKNNEELQKKLIRASEKAIGRIIKKTLVLFCETENITVAHLNGSVNETEVHKEMRVVVNELLEILGISHVALRGEDPTFVANWDLAGAFYFCLTTVTTIGYGNFAPTSNGSRLLTVVYALVGIPGFLYLCAQVSSAFSDMFSKLRKWCRADNSPIGNRFYYTLCCLIVFTLLILIPLPGTMKGQNLDLVTSIYFLVITLTTVGYGDIYPTDPAEAGKSSDLFRISFCLVLWAYMIVGLSLFANLISIVQSWIARAAEADTPVPRVCKDRHSKDNDNFRSSDEKFKPITNTVYSDFKRTSEQTHNTEF